ncbi:MAG: FAD-dependent oxidoreductase [Firmicutes bacterium]|nr:FAD-dependent oxidoreductase [Bacillota bacterium]
MNSSPLRLLVVGGGWAGASLVAALLPYARGQLAITVVDPFLRRPFMPDLVHALDWPAPRLLASTWSPAPLWHKAGVRWVRDLATALDPVRHRLECATHRPLEFDLAVLATGAVADWDGVPGLDGGRLSLTNAPHAALVADQLPRFTPTGPLALVVAAPVGKPTSVPPLDLPAISALTLYRAKDPRPRAKRPLLLLTPYASLAESLGQTAGQELLNRLKQLGIVVMAGARVERSEQTAVYLAGQARPLKAAHLLWLPPLRNRAWLFRSGLCNPEGWVPVNAWQQHVDFPDLYAIGDCAAGRLKWGSIATASAATAARHIAHRLKGGTLGSPPQGRPVEWVAPFTSAQGLYAVGAEGTTLSLAFGRMPLYLAGWQRTWARRRGWIPSLWSGARGEGLFQGQG